MQMPLCEKYTTIFSHSLTRKMNLHRKDIFLQRSIEIEWRVSLKYWGEKFESINKAQQKFDKLLCKTSLRERVAWCVYSLLLLVSNQFFVIPICLVTFLQLWFSSLPFFPHTNCHQYFPIIFPSCVSVCRPSIENVRERLEYFCSEWKVELISSEMYWVDIQGGDCRVVRKT